jgi:hypothetical protein
MIGWSSLISSFSIDLAVSMLPKLLGKFSKLVLVLLTKLANYHAAKFSPPWSGQILNTKIGVHRFTID